MLVGVAAVLVIAGSLILGKKKSAAGADRTDAPEEFRDPNYTGILDEDDGDPYDRSYGFSADDDAEDDAETGSDNE